MMRGTPYIYQGEELGMTNAHYSDISQYRDVESLNYYEILLSEGKSKEEALVVFNNLTGGKIVLQAKPEWKTYHKLLGNYEKEYEIENGGEIILEPYETLVLEK